MILLLDNQDSFVHNLARYFRRSGAETLVLRSNQLSASEALALQPAAVVLSPGPHGPEEAGCCVDLLRAAPDELPFLGVCLGHQAIGAAFGGEIVRCAPRHAMASPIQHDGRRLFSGCSSPMSVARYHSLAIDLKSMPDCLSVTATSLDDGVVMAVSHRSRPVYGVQFHPESVLCEDGMQIIKNFASLARTHA